MTLQRNAKKRSDIEQDMFFNSNIYRISLRFQQNRYTDLNPFLYFFKDTFNCWNLNSSTAPRKVKERVSPDLNDDGSSASTYHLDGSFAAVNSSFLRLLWMKQVDECSTISVDKKQTNFFLGFTGFDSMNWKRSKRYIVPGCRSYKSDLESYLMTLALNFVSNSTISHKNDTCYSNSLTWKTYLFKF